METLKLLALYGIILLIIVPSFAAYVWSTLRGDEWTMIASLLSALLFSVIWIILAEKWNI